ncbi:hypothetical protein [Archangium minus]|uniref:hypothetical protein n=1 Tax=Archangium minus TaxID=83450 RepID=UPI0037BF0F4F
MAFLGKGIPHKEVRAKNGGRCLAKHEPGYKEKCSCSHRWQAFEQALAHSGTYKLQKAVGEGSWELLFRGNHKAVAAVVNRGLKATLSPDNKGMYLHEVAKPRPEDWDISRDKRNFKWDCNVPYYHEAHHVVPDATLRKIFLAIFGPEEGGSNELVIKVVAEVLEAPYCVHHMENMLILPMDEKVGDALQLPIHRETKQCSHSAYDEYVEARLKSSLMAALEQIMKKHKEEKTEEPKYKDLATTLTKEAETLYGEVAAARRTQGFTSVEQMGQRLKAGL